MKASVAFDVCLEIYKAAREIVDSRLSTMQFDSSSKFLWRPDRRPRLVEFVADFALAGDRALTETAKRRSCNCVRQLRSSQSTQLSTRSLIRRGAPDVPQGANSRRDVSQAQGHGHAHGRDCRRDPAVCACRLERAAHGELRASRLILFRMYYLGGAEYQAARRLLGISELTWSDWTQEIRTRVGRELMRAGMFPPGKYFRERTSARQEEPGGK